MQTKGKARVLSGACAALSILALPVAHAGKFEVYGYGGPEKGESEFVYSLDYVQSSNNTMTYFGKTGVKREGLSDHTVEIEYGVSDKFSVAAYGDFEKPSGEDFEYIQTRAVLARYNFWEKGAKAVDTAVYVEYYRPKTAYYGDKRDAIELRFIFEKEIGGYDVRFNPIIEKVINGPHKNDKTELEFSAAIYKPMSDKYEIGLEAYKTETPATEHTGDNEEVYVAPAAEVELAHGVALHGALAFGASKPADDLIISGRLEVEL